VAAGWPVLSVLLIASIVTVAAVWERWKYFGRIHTDSPKFLESIRANRDAQKVIAFCEKSDQPLAKITRAVYKAPANREDKERALTRSIQSLAQDMEVNISLLATVASVAPFVGLLGTVIGIIRAFRAVSMSAGGASLVAIGISEALIGTAAGLVVAIPALLFYNYFANKIRRLTQDWEIFGGEIVDISLGKGGL
jgi:biopolymer transport protein ExbB/TolQ